MIRRIKKGLKLPITGEPTQNITDTKKVKTVAVTGFDYVGMKPTMHVQAGDTVKKGQPLFDCKKTPGVTYTSPAAGTVKEINRGERRVFQTMVIEVAENEDHVSFKNYSGFGIESLNTQQVKDLMIESGMWTALRTRPFSKVPQVDSKPHSIFVTAIDSNPLSPSPRLFIHENLEAFRNGLSVLAHLTEGNVNVVKSTDVTVNVPESSRVHVHEFSGVHPAGNVGTHIHFIDPVSADKQVWHIGYQDVIAIGHLFVTGKLFTERVVSIAGPQVTVPKVVRTRVGACLCEMTEGELKSGNNRVISGSVFNGRKSDDVFCYLGRYHNQVSVLAEGTQRELLGWHTPGFNRFSIKPIYVSKLMPWKKFDFTTDQNGSLRAIVPIGSYESVMPLDILPTQLLRALASKDTDYAQQLGCLELDEEDLALCTFASTSKIDYGPVLRETLDIIEKEG